MIEKGKRKISLRELTFLLLITLVLSIGIKLDVHADGFSATKIEKISNFFDSKYDDQIERIGNDDIFYLKLNNVYYPNLSFTVQLKSKTAEIVSVDNNLNMNKDYPTMAGLGEFEVKKVEDGSYKISVNTTGDNTSKSANYLVYRSVACWMTIKDGENESKACLILDNQSSTISACPNGMRNATLYDADSDVALYDSKGKTYTVDFAKKNSSAVVDVNDAQNLSGILSVRVEGEKEKKASNKNGIQDWLTSDENYISINGTTPVRVNQSNATEGNYNSQKLYLKKGTNIIQVTSVAKLAALLKTGTELKTYQLAKEDQKVGITVPQNYWREGASTEYMSLKRKIQYYTCFFVVNYDGEEKTVTKSGDTSLSYLEAVECAFSKNTTESRKTYTVRLAKGTEDDPSLLAVPDDIVVLGIVPTDPLATWKLSQEYQNLQCGDRIGKYIAVDMKKIEDGGSFSIDVTAADQTVTKRYFKITKKANACELTGIDVTNGTLTSDVSAETRTYHINADGSASVGVKVTASEGATIKINGVETNEINVEDLADLLEIQIIAEDTISEKTYYVIFDLNGENQFFKTSQSTADDAKTLLHGWENRSADEKKDMFSEGYWGVFKSLATNVSFDDALVKDVGILEYTQATTYGAAIMQLVICGENPYDYNGVNYVDKLMEYYDESIGSFGAYGNCIWGLMGLRAAGASIPEKLINTVKGQAKSESFDLDMRGWAIAATASYMTETEKIDILMSLKKSQLRCAADLTGKVTDVENLGLFLSNTMKSANTFTNGCILTGIAALGADVEHFFTVSTDINGKYYETNPVKALSNCKTADGKFYNNYSDSYNPSYMHSAAFGKDIIIGLADIYYGKASWDMCYLTMDEYTELLKVAKTYVGTTTDDSLNQRLQEAITAADNAKNNSSNVNGLGKYYYTLYSVLKEVSSDAVNEPKNLRTIRKLSDNDAVNAVDKMIATFESTENIYESAKVVIEAKNAYDALGNGQDEEYVSRLQSYVGKADILLTAYNTLQTVLPVIEAIDNLPETATTEAEAAIEAARVAYVALSDAEKAGVYNYSKLADLLAQLAQLKDKATAVSEQINVLPAAEQVTLENEAAIAAARAAYDALSDAEKAAVANYDKLQAAEQQIGNIKAAAEVTQMIDAIGEITLDNYETKYEQIVTARSAYDNLAEGAKALVTNLDTLKKAEETYQSMDEDVKEVIAAINQLKDPLSKSNADMDANTLYGIWNEYTYVVVNIRGLADELTKEKQAIVTNINDLKTAEAYIQKIKDSEKNDADQAVANEISQNRLDNAKKLLDELPDAKDYTPAEGGTANIPDEIITKVAQAKAVTGVLSEEQKATLDQDKLNNLKDLVTLTETLAGYKDTYESAKNDVDQAAKDIRDVAAARQYVKELTEVYNTYKDKEVSRSDITIIRQTIKAYDDLTEAQKDIIKNAEEASTITAMLDALKKQDEQVQKDEKAAAEVTEYIKNLPTSLNLDNMEAVRSDLQMIADKYNALNANAQSYVRMLSKVTATNNVLNTMTAEINTFRQGKPAVTAAATAYNSVTVSWNTYQYAQSYDVYRKTAGGEWTKLGNTTALQYVDQTAAGSTAYSYTVVALSSRWGQSVSSAYDENGAAVTTPAAPQPDNSNTTPDNGNTTPDNNNTPTVKDYTSLNATSAGVSSIKLSWKKVSKASGYVVYRANSANGKYKAIKTIKKGKTTSFTDKKRTTGKTYYYKLRPYKTVKNKKQYMDYSSVVSTKAVPGRVKFTKLTAGNQKATLKWKKVSGASGYLLYRSDRRDGGFTCINSVSSRKTSYTNTKLKKGQTYYYRIRAYRKVGGKRVYGNFSVVKAVKVK